MDIANPRGDESFNFLENEKSRQTVNFYFSKQERDISYQRMSRTEGNKVESMFASKFGHGILY